VGHRESRIDLVSQDGEEGERLRRAVAQRWTPLDSPPPHWMQLKMELRELNARLEDADDAF
jgi:hypothetical protein